ncbi:MAG TPA: Crp/Fnr family transcriptional regulator [Gemmatimonadales bacterium]|nr:Crp/Fnr family transcriptional regulator [Gemmatimonadales bacterium]
MAEPVARGTARNGNRLLSQLPPEDLGRLRSHLVRVSTQPRDPLWEPDQPIQNVLFPLSSVNSILAVDDNGGQVEVGTVGNEGLVGLPLFLGARSAPGRAFTQIAGDSLRMDAGVFTEFATSMASLRRRLQLYTQAFVVQVSQSVACNQLHSADQRLARWLLSCADRVGEDRFPLTQEFMAQMLGVRRATVSEAASSLQDRGLVKYSRGTLEICDRPGLIEAACSCYRIVRDQFDKLLGMPRG